MEMKMKLSALRTTIALAIIAFGLPAVGAKSAVMQVPAASFTPVNVPGTTALGASPESLRKYGYVEQEYYVSGTANRYRFKDALSDAQLVDGGYPYKTRMLVRRPADPSKFNGTVTVEWYNVTTGQDVDFDYAASHEYLLRKGYAIVAVSVQRVGVDTLKSWSPARYGDLSLTAPPLDSTPGGAPSGPGPANSTPRGLAGPPDILAWDVFSQTSRACALHEASILCPA
jgi:Alpha/beta hydrolase domain